MKPEDIFYLNYPQNFSYISNHLLFRIVFKFCEKFKKFHYNKFK